MSAAYTSVDAIQESMERQAIWSARTKKHRFNPDFVNMYKSICWADYPFAQYKREDLTGRTYGKLTVLLRFPCDDFFNTRYECRCECGNIIVIRADTLKQKRANDCGYWCELRGTK